MILNILKYIWKQYMYKQTNKQMLFVNQDAHNEQ